MKSPEMIIFTIKLLFDAKVQNSDFLKYIRFRSFLKFGCPKYQIEE